MRRGLQFIGFGLLVAVLAGCGGDGSDRRPDKRERDRSIQPLDRVAVSTPGNWTEIQRVPPAAPPRETTAVDPVPADEVPEIAVRSRLSVTGTTGGLIGDEFLPVQSMRPGDTRRVVLGDPSDGAEIVYDLRSVREGDALLRVTLRIWGRRHLNQTWMTRLDGAAGQTFQAAARGGGIVRLEISADGVPQKPQEVTTTNSVLEELRRRQPPPMPASPN